MDWNFNHSMVSSNVFRLIESYSLDIAHADGGFNWVVELYRARAGLYRARIWEVESITAPSPYAQPDGEIFLADYRVRTEQSGLVEMDTGSFDATSDSDALRKLEIAITKHLDHAFFEHGD